MAMIEGKHNLSDTVINTVLTRELAKFAENQYEVTNVVQK